MEALRLMCADDVAAAAAEDVVCKGCCAGGTELA